MIIFVVIGTDGEKEIIDVKDSSSTQGVEREVVDVDVAQQLHSEGFSGTFVPMKVNSRKKRCTELFIARHELQSGYEMQRIKSKRFTMLR
ncbi:Hypothetical predicted protein, partial [Olea europaea subsp. europaea]